ncbi:MAG: ankyrin repeat domain-containing protein [Polyangiaceae bacterium]|nr:ankyrin repeat domain-containing protein [Polyangiaceae bacterium]
MDDEVGAAIERLYALAKVGEWDKVLLELSGDLRLAAICARYQKPSSGWTFLHQTAYFGHEQGVRAFVGLGASLDVKSNEGETPADVAERRGHRDLSQSMHAAAKRATVSWKPPQSPELRPSSCAWEEAEQRRALLGLRAAYGGSVVVIPPGSRYYVDSFERILVGWHGTFNPPLGMDAESLLPPPTLNTEGT